jgi:hypothetical protein
MQDQNILKPYESRKKGLLEELVTEIEPESTKQEHAEAALSEFLCQ